MKSILVIFFCFIASVNLYSNDTYVLTFNKDSNCSLTKNGDIIPVYDPRFEKKAPRSHYTCTAMQKENYVNCSTIKSTNTTAEMLAFGRYEKTNLIFGFKNPTPNVTSMMEIECTKKLKE